MTPTAFYLLFLLGLAFFFTGLFADDHQHGFIFHMFSFGFNLLAAMTAHNIIVPTAAGSVTITGNFILGGISLGICLISTACMVWRGGRAFAEQGGPL